MDDRPARPPATGALPGPPDLRHQLEVLRDRLLHTDFRNPSVRVQRANTPRNYDLALSETMDPGVTERILHAALAGRGRECLVPSGDLSPDSLVHRKVLYKVARTVRLVRDETGVDDLYVGFPFLTGHLPDGHHIRGPIFLFPATLEKRANDPQPGWFVSLESSRDPVPNRALLEVLRKKTDIDLLDALDAALQELIDHPLPPGVPAGPAIRQRIGPILQQVKLIADYVPAEEVLPRVDPLPPVHGSSYTEGPREPLSVRSHLLLGRFPQGSTSIHEDYLTLLAGEELPTGLGSVLPLLQAEAGEPTTVEPLTVPERPSSGPAPVRCVLPSDTSQDATIEALKRVPALVTQGPPGTGKSQLIVNLIGDALSGGEHVLVVCQKRAALDVVQQRLQRVGLDRFAALVQDAVADRKALYQKLGARITEAATRPPGRDPGPELARVEAAIDGALRDLESWEATLREERYGGLSLHTLYTAGDLGFPVGPATPDLVRSLLLSDLDSATPWLPQLESGFARFDAPGTPFAGWRPFQRTAATEPAECGAALDAVGAKAGASPLFQVGDMAAQRGALALLVNYRYWSQRWSRLFSPSWWRTRRGVLDLRSRVGRSGTAPDMEVLEQGLRAGADLASATRALSVWLTPAEALSLSDLSQRDRASLVGRLARLKGALPEWPAVVAYDDALLRLTPPLRELFRQTKALPWGTELPIEERLRRAALTGWTRLYERGTAFQSTDVFASYLATRERLASLLQQRSELTAQLIRYQGDERLRPKPIVAPPKGKKNPPSSRDTLLRELTKRSRTKPLRELVRSFGKDLLDVAPCWLVSPEAASDVFPLVPGLFDLVVFDEASQLAVERAVPAVLRGRRCLIGGDEQQLPPFDLFQLGDGDEDDEELAEGDDAAESLRAQSLLDLALGVFPKTQLSWHYRSRWQELIDFSNHVFYDWMLHVSPNSTRKLSTPPIRYLQVEGKWEKNSNLVEAEKVVDVLEEVLSKRGADGKLPSVGIVSFNHPQRRLIEDRIEERRSVDPRFNASLSEVETAEELDQRLFVKNIEQVQGDERDVVIFSIGYAPLPNGRVAVRFGPLNEQGGEKRLNVAVTRAREGMVVVASFSPSQLDTSGSKNLGPKILEGFLNYAEAVSQGDPERLRAVFAKYGGLAGQKEELPLKNVLGPALEVRLQDALRQRGLESDLFVGRGRYKVGLGIVDPRDATRYVLGIETDGPMYASGRTAVERDVVRQQFLEKAGWTLERVWSQRWYRDPGSEVDRIVKRVRELSSRPSPPKGEVGAPARSKDAGKIPA